MVWARSGCAGAAKCIVAGKLSRGYDVMVSLHVSMNLCMPGGAVITPTLLDASGIVLLYFPLSHDRMMRLCYVIHLVPLPCLAVCAQCCGDNSLVCTLAE